MIAAIEQLLVGPIRWCGRHQHLYKAGNGYAATGIGHMVMTARAMQELPWVIPGVPDGMYVSDAEKLTTWVKVSNMPAGLRVAAYASSTALRLMNDDVDRLAHERAARELIPRLELMCAGFAGYPLQAQQVLVDMVHDIGMGAFGKYQRLRAACAAGNWRGAAQACVRTGAKPPRNAWAQALFLELA